MELGLKIVGIGFDNIVIHRVRSSVHGILDRAHPLLGFTHALKVEVSAVFAQDLENLDIASPDSKEHPAKALVTPLLVNINLLFPKDGLVCLSLKGIQLLFLLLLRVVFLCCWVFIDDTINIFNKLGRLFEEEVDDLLVATHDSDMNYARAFFVFLVIDVD